MAHTIGTILVVLALAATRAPAQDDPRILFSGPEGFERNPIATALFNLGYLDTVGVFQREELLLPALRDGHWDLVIIRWFDTFEGPLAGAIIDELAAHVDGGGKLIFSMARLDEQPEMWPILGITRAADVEEPLQDLVATYGGIDPDQWHLAFSGLWRVNDDPFLPITSDYGDRLEPAVGSFPVAVYEADRTAGIVLSNDGRVVVTGPHWDYWDLGGIRIAEDQVRWLLHCPADLDGDGELTVFDFFEFQNRFDSGGATGFADFDYDGRLDVFDFLEFFNLFEAGC
ncbi:MAG: GC-type dockerin domain-anchored protein [Phycisphaerales bacterium JB060]